MFVEKNLKNFLKEKMEQNRMRTGGTQIPPFPMPAMITVNKSRTVIVSNHVL